jgi:hypothetical protein
MVWGCGVARGSTDKTRHGMTRDDTPGARNAGGNNVCYFTFEGSQSSLRWVQLIRFIQGLYHKILIETALPLTFSTLSDFAIKVPPCSVVSFVYGSGVRQWQSRPLQAHFAQFATRSQPHRRMSRLNHKLILANSGCLSSIPILKRRTGQLKVLQNQP